MSTNQHASQGSYNDRLWTIRQGISFAFLTLSAKLSSKKLQRWRLWCNQRRQWRATGMGMMRSGGKVWKWRLDVGSARSEVCRLQSRHSPRTLTVSNTLLYFPVLWCTPLYFAVLCYALLYSAWLRLAFSLQSSQLLCPWSILPRPRRTAGWAANSKPCTLYFPCSSVSPWSTSYDFSVHWRSIPKRTPSKSICISNWGFWTDPSPSPLLDSAQRVGFFNIGSGRVGYWTKYRVAGRVRVG